MREVYLATGGDRGAAVDFSRLRVLGGEEMATERDRLLREAAELGPGRRGRRRAGTRDERLALARRLEEAGADLPPYLESPAAWVDRRARLFEAGEYPDKGVTVTTEQLDALAAGFDLPVPVLIEHAESPLELGYLTHVWCEGETLMGTVALTPEADALLARASARGLSLGLSPDLSAIREVSLVRHPRVASATLFAEGPVFVGALAPDDRWARERVAGWVRSGLLRPAQAEFAEALMGFDGTVAFGEGRASAAELVERLVQSGVGHGLFAEVAPDPVREADATAEAIADEEAAFYRRYFPDVPLAEIARRR